MSDYIFLKLGGSLITDKNKPHTPNIEVIKRAAEEINSAIRQTCDIQLIIGHGSGSFGHVPAKKYTTRQGVYSADEWIGFQKVWYEARALNQIVIEILSAAGLPIIAFPPSASLTSSNREISNWNVQPIMKAVQSGLIPLINGDVVIDQVIGGTIFSTEELFFNLSKYLTPSKILLAGIEPGVWADFPRCTKIVKEITTLSFPSTNMNLGPSKSVDVTGGMLNKVEIMLDIIKFAPACQGAIFSGLIPGNIQESLLGVEIGTQMRDGHVTE